MTIEFYKSVLPPVGLRVLAVFKGGLKKAPTHLFYDTDEDLFEAAETYNNLGKNVYHACAAYTTTDNRTGDNVAAVKALWLDLDVGDNKPYASQRDAAAHYEQFREALGLPKSHVVASGGGLHEYLPFSKAILPEQWDRLAEMFRACLDHFGVKHDSSRTTDKASILRIPGTHNFKTDPPKNVTLKRLGDEVPASVLWTTLKTYADANGLIVGAKASKGKPAATNKLIGVKDYPPSVGELVAANCAVLEEVAATGGDVGYEVWWRAMGVAKATTEPTATAVFWTRDRESTGHEKFDAQGTMDAWAYGPTTCAEFAKHSGKCASCPQFGKGKSPIQLGYPEVPPVVPLQQNPVNAATPALSSLVWGFGEQWIMDAVAKATRTGFDKGSMTMSVMQEDGTYKHVSFCDRYWQVMRRVRTEDGIWQLEIGYQQYPGKPHKTFLLDSAAVTAPDVLRKEFSARELHIYGGPRAMNKTQEIIRYMQDLKFQHQEETVTYPTMGWVSEGNTMRGNLTGEFVLGPTVFRPKEKPQTVLLADTVDQSLRSDFRTSGTTQEWVDAVDRIYNRRGAEPYQFIIAAMFGAPLVRLMPGDGDWHGIPIVVGGESGAAKTSTCLVGMSIYAPAQLLRFNAQGGTNGQGDTINALSIKLGSLRNLPCIMDEMTNSEADKISNIMYMTANGKSKDRMGPNGKMIPNPYRWDTLSLITSNDTLHEVLKGLRSQNAQEASQLRSFQISLRKYDLFSVFKGVTRNEVENELLAKQFGMVGHEWIQFVVNNRLKISKKLEEERVRYMVDPSDGSDIRFYKDLLITVKVAATLAHAKGFIKWDVTAMLKWAEGELIILRDNVSAKDWDGTISDFIASLHGRTIVSRHMKTGPGKRSTTNREIPMEPLSTSPTAFPIARKAVDDRRFFVTANALKEWSHTNRVMPSTLLAQMVERGYIHCGEGLKVQTHLVSLGSGTTVTRPQAPCYELEFDKLSSAAGGDGAVDMTNVVSITPLPVTETVTDPGNEEGAASATP